MKYDDFFLGAVLGAIAGAVVSMMVFAAVAPSPRPADDQVRAATIALQRAFEEKVPRPIRVEPPNECPPGWNKLIPTAGAGGLVCEYVGLTWAQCQELCRTCEGEWPGFVSRAGGCANRP